MRSVDVGFGRGPGLYLSQNRLGPPQHPKTADPKTLNAEVKDNPMLPVTLLLGP